MKTTAQKALLIASAAALVTTCNQAAATGAEDLMRPRSTRPPVVEVARVTPRVPAPVPLGTPQWLPLSKDGSYVRELLNPVQQEALLKAVGVEQCTAQETVLLQEGLESVLHAKGSQFGSLTLDTAASRLASEQGHGFLFEQKVARFLQEQGRKVDYTGAGNAGVDLRAFPTSKQPMTMVQVKATGSSLKSTQGALLDALEFAGGDVNRIGSLKSGKINFEGCIPWDQANELMKDGYLLKDGTPTPKLIDRVMKQAKEVAAGSGPKAERVKAALLEDPTVLESIKVKPGPVTYGEVVSDAKAFARLASRLSKQLAKASAQASKAAAEAAKQARKGAGEVARSTEEAAKAGTVTEPSRTLKTTSATRGGKSLRSSQVVEAAEQARGVSTAAQEAGALKTAGKFGMAGVGVLGSGVQTYEGVQQLKQGHYVEGAGNLGGGVANATSSVAALAGRAALSGSTMAIGAGIDGGLDLYKGITQKNPEKTTVGTIKSGAAVAMGVGVATGQPEVVVPAAIVYGGAVASDVIYENRVAIQRGLNNAASKIYYASGAVCDYVRGR